MSALRPDALVVAFLTKTATHYRVDESVVKRKTRRDKAREHEEARAMGFYTITEYKRLPIGRIVSREIWKPARARRVRDEIDRGKALAPIDVAETSPGRYEIEDGIHRYNVSMERNYTHIPAFVTRTVKAPELYEEPEAEKPALKEGTYVKMRKPQEGLVWAVVDEALGGRIMKGIKRQVYSLFAADAKQVKYIGDFRDDELDPGNPPPAVRRQLDNRL